MTISSSIINGHINNDKLILNFKKDAESNYKVDIRLSNLYYIIAYIYSTQSLVDIITDEKIPNLFKNELKKNKTEFNKLKENALNGLKSIYLILGKYNKDIKNKHIVDNYYYNILNMFEIIEANNNEILNTNFETEIETLKNIKEPNLEELLQFIIYSYSLHNNIFIGSNLESVKKSIISNSNAYSKQFNEKIEIGALNENFKLETLKFCYSLNLHLIDNKNILNNNGFDITVKDYEDINNVYSFIMESVAYNIWNEYNRIFTVNMLKDFLTKFGDYLKTLKDSSGENSSENDNEDKVKIRKFNFDGYDSDRISEFSGTDELEN